MKNARFASLLILLLLVASGCHEITKPPVTTPVLVANDTPAHAVERLVVSYERKDESAFAGMFTGDYTFEFSNSTDPNLVTEYSTGWFKDDEKQASSHLFSGYTPPGQTKLEAAASIDINFAVTAPTDDNSSGVDPATHKFLATRVDGTISIPEPGMEPLNFVMTNNYNVLYLVRGDVASNLDASQPADVQHWYVYRWVDLSQSNPSAHAAAFAAQSATWSRVKAIYR